MGRSIHIGIVSRNNDPERLGRIRVKCQTLAGARTELPQWVKPCFPFTSSKSAGWFFVPEVGSEVELEVLEGTDSDETYGESFIASPDIHYRAGLYSAANPLPDEFQEHYPKRRGLRTPSGHLLILDDEDGMVKLSKAQNGTADDVYLEMAAGASNAVLKASQVLLGAADAVEQAVLGTTYRAEEGALNAKLTTHFTTISAQMAVLGTALATAGAALTAAGPQLILLPSGGASVAAAGAALVTASAAAVAMGTVSGQAATDIATFEGRAPDYLSNTTKSK